MNKHVKRGSLLAGMLVVLALGLGGCAGQGPQETAGIGGTKGGIYELEVKQPFEGHEANDFSSLKAIADKAVEAGADRKGSDKKPEEGEQISAVADEFSKGNDAYRAGNYEEAVEHYLKVTEGYPLHLGANVNLTLAYLQLEDDEAALLQALTCAYLFPDDPGTLINAQVAGTACGYATQDIATVLEDVCDKPVDAILSGSEFVSYWDYNALWSRIETELHDAAQADDETSAATEEGAEEGGADTTEEAATEEAAAEAAEAGADEPASEEPTGGREAYHKLQEDFDTLEETLTDDDEAALRAYLYTVGLQLGYEVDTSFVDPATVFPYTVAKDELCTIVLTDREELEGTWEMGIPYTLTNNSDQTIVVGAAEPWTSGGEPCGVKFDEQTVGAGETVEGKIFFGLKFDSLEGVIRVQDSDGAELALYPLAWELADEE